MVGKFLEDAISPVAREIGEGLADLVNLAFTPIQKLMGLFLLLRGFYAAFQQFVVDVVGSAIVKTGFDQFTAKPCP